MAAGIVELSPGNFNKEVKEAAGLVVVDFWGEGCPPCRAIAPLLEELAGKSEGKYKIAKINIQENMELAGQFNIRAVPTLIFFKGGQVKDVIVGLTSKKDLESRIAALS